MGQQFIIKLKDPNESYSVNKLLQINDITCNKFLTYGELSEWVYEINKDESHPLRHLKPEGRQMLMRDLQRAIPSWTEVGKFQADIAFNRTPKDQVYKISKFVHDYKNIIEYVKSAKFMIDRFNIKGAQAVTLTDLDPDTSTGSNDLISKYNLMVSLNNRRIEIGDKFVINTASCDDEVLLEWYGRQNSAQLVVEDVDYYLNAIWIEGCGYSIDINDAWKV